ncbi:hypothetical protein PMG11_06006 [Penicillium brasilianum]|uniref:Tat pathway signal sequence n=1 Tax=Penicillium brasilianum TaxID=104259 RepID=A0A0F7TL19_PENBI|nr:hypothetical protein PMG11_06006 [Penicillium brasilianum]
MFNYIRPYEKLNLTKNTSIEDIPKESRPYSQCTSIAACLFAFTAILSGAQILYLWSYPAPTCRYAFDTGYPTEWRPAVESIKLEEINFTSPLRYNTTLNQLYRDIDITRPEYIGAPSPEIDAAWESLLGGQFLVLGDDEAVDLDDPVSIEGRWVGEVEVMHSLHCLNMLRKALSPEYYGPVQPHSRQSVHLEHCFEQVRQSIQCAGDLTPVVLRPLGEGSNVVVVGTPMVHTCRSWDALRTWYTHRGEAQGKVARREF